MKAEKLIYFCSYLLTKVFNFRKNLHDFNPKSILFIKKDEVGDMVYATPIFRIIKNKYPTALTNLWCKSSVAQIIKSNPFIDQIIFSEKELAKHYDLIIDLRGDFKTLKYALLHPPKIRLDRGTVRLKNKLIGKHPHELQTNYEIIKTLILDSNPILLPEIKISDDDEIIAINWLSENEIKNFALLHVGANNELRKWAVQNFADLAVYLKSTYALEIVFLGNESDISSIQKVQQLIPFKTYSIANIFNWTNFAALTKKAILFIGNESGPLHIAAAMQTPSLGLFGPGEPDIFYPQGEKVQIVHHVLFCNPCNQINCINPENTCMQRITLAEVKVKISILQPYFELNN